MDALVEIRDLSVEFPLDHGAVHAVRGISFDVPRGKTLGIVGESGSGKTTTALALLGLAGGVVRGSMQWRANADAPVELARLSQEEWRRLRGREIAMVFQEPSVALNPVYTIGEQIAEVLRLHRGKDRREAREAAITALAKVGIADPARRVDAYPHEISGGMRQRAMIAVALAGEPRLLLADEPTASLDVTVQAGILDLLRARQAETGMTLAIITHDLGIVAELCDDVVVMKQGEIVERAPVDAIFHAPAHEYTRALLAAAGASPHG